MSTDDTANERRDADDDAERSTAGRDGDGAPAVEDLDQGLVDLLAWVLDTETRARIYVYLRIHPGSTSREVADGTGLYPSTVREALAELNADRTVSRRKREAGGAGNNPYEYEAIPPADLVVGVVDRVESELNTVYTLDDRLAGCDSDEAPISIAVATTESPASVNGSGADSAASADESAAGTAGAATRRNASGRAASGRAASGRAAPGRDGSEQGSDPVGADDD